MTETVTSRPWRRRAAAGAAALALSWAVAGCGSTAPTAVSSNTPQYGGTFTMAYQSDVPTLDPAGSPGYESAQVMYGIYNTLVTYAPTSETLVPSLATSWTVTDGGRVYTFYLRPHVRFSNGDPLTAQDVVFNLMRQINPKNASYAQSYYLDIQGAQAYASGKANSVSGLQVLSPTTLRIVLVQPEGYFLNILAMPTSDIADPRVVEEYGPAYSDHAVGTGPYELHQWIHNQVLIETRNPYYWGKKPYFSTIKFILGPDPQTQFLMFRRGEIDAMGPVPPSDMPTIESTPSLKRDLLVLADNGSIDFYFMDVDYGPFRSLLVRRALNLAVNRERLVALDAGQAVPANQYLPPGYPGSEPNLPPIPYNPTKARQLLREAGYKPGQLTLTLTVNNDPAVVQQAESVMANFQAIGVNVHLVTMSLSAYITALSENKVKFGIIQWGIDYPDPSDIFDSLLLGAADGTGNFAWFNNSRFNHLVNEADTMSPNLDQERYRLYDQAQAIAMQQAPWIPLIFPASTELVSPALRPAPVGADKYLYLGPLGIEENLLWK
jgi:peptide/nickel transport system substrate-binding protein/oligopeptide transport system substrate-binding protein